MDDHAVDVDSRGMLSALSIEHESKFRWTQWQTAPTLIFSRI